MSSRGENRQGSGRVYQRAITQIRRVLELLSGEKAFKLRSEQLGKSGGKNMGAVRGREHGVLEKRGQCRGPMVGRGRAIQTKSEGQESEGSSGPCG